MDSVGVRHARLSDKKPILVRSTNPIACADAFYVLPAALLEKCFEVLPLENKAHEAIVVSSQRQNSQPSQSDTQNQPGGMIDCVRIGDLLFTRKDLETMKRASDLK